MLIMDLMNTFTVEGMDIAVEVGLKIIELFYNNFDYISLVVILTA